MTGAGLSGLALGLVLAAQVGPVTLLIMRSVLRGGRALAVGLAMAVAVAAMDVLYAALGLAGVGQLLGGGAFRLALGLVSATLLLVLGARTAWQGLRARLGLEDEPEVVTPRPAFVTAVAATALNPLTIALWTLSFPASVPRTAMSSDARMVVLLAGVAVGTLALYCSFATLVALARRRMGDRLIRGVEVVSGCTLLAFGGVLAYRTAFEHEAASD